ncbi:MAG: hypothetical protein KatS3mg110_0155 [Pirellulaceae bacterium]|nr:MAG: hypothetical protein KatS3mg110_0155 [Pirellulaceae bacterium]
MAAKGRTGPLYPEANLVPDADDELISSEELAQIGLFGALKRKIKVEEAPGSLVLRRFRPGEVICRQGEPGNSAFYLVPAEDMLKLRRYQLEHAPEDLPQERRRRWQQDLAQLEALPHGAERPVVARAYLFFEEREPKRSWWRFWSGRRPSSKLPETIAVDAPVEIATASRTADLCEGDIFGEMSCLMFTPRSATIIAQRECFAVEFLRSVLDSLQREESFRQQMDAAYRQRVLDSHLKRLQFLSDVTDEELSFLRPHVELEVRQPGEVIFEEGDPPHAAYIVRSGFVQIVQNLEVSLKPRHIPRLPAFCQRLCEAKQEKPVAAAAGSSAAAALMAKLRSAKAPEGSPAPSGPPDSSPSPPQPDKSVQPPPAPSGSVSPADILARARAAGAASAPKPASEPSQAQPQPADNKESSDEPAADREALVREPAASGGLSPIGWLWYWLAPGVQQAVERIAHSSEPDPDDCLLLTQALNELARNRKWLAGASVKPLWQSPGLSTLVAAFPKGVDGIGKDWSDMQVRTAGRELLHVLAPEFIPPRSRASAPPRIIRYIGRGECFGELGVVLQTPRTAAAIAYDHPGDEQRRAASRVELVRIPAEAFRTFLQRVPRLADRVRSQIAHYQRLDQERAVVSPLSTPGVTGTPEFGDLGLAQGQKLLLIDLDRCTRCGDCVRACINTHDDGHTRLYLDGPRFDRFLVPAACRQCRDPLCMIGCPVGSIQRGDNGQIVIREWCIGCGLCARQCPYESIQMHDLGLVPESAVGWRVIPESALADDHWWEPGYRCGNWPVLAAPFYWSPDMAEALARHSRCSRDWKSADRLLEPLCFRYDFRADSSWRRKPGFVIECTTKVGEVEAWFNGQPCELERGSGRIDAQRLAAGRNTLCVKLKPTEKAPPLPYDTPFLRIWLGALPQVTQLTRQFIEDLQAAQFKLQAARAVVCDLCSDLPGRQPACVRECPHEAAIRVDALAEFPSLD